jgi:hypothetical protein
MSSFRDWASATARMVVTAIVTTAFIIALLTAVYSGANQRQAENDAQLNQVATTLVSTNQAIACELALPVGAHGRDPDLVRACFIQYSLDPPTILNPEPGTDGGP